MVICVDVYNYHMYNYIVLTCCMQFIGLIIDMQNLNRLNSNETS